MTGPDNKIPFLATPSAALHNSTVESILTARFGKADLSHAFFSDMYAICKDHLTDNPSAIEFADPLQLPRKPAVPEAPLTATIEQLFDRKITMLPLPRAVQNLQQVLQQPNCSATDIAKAISVDPQLSVSLLRIVNSPLYRPVIKVDTISRAVALLGSRQVYSLVLGASLVRNIHKELGASLNMQRFWKHSIATAITSALLAQQLGMKDPEPYFVAGLLHDIGRLFMLSSHPDMMEQAVYNSIHEGHDLYIEETRLFGFDHSAIGAHFLEQWNLSENIVRAVAAHHSLKESLECHETCVIHVADLITKAMGYHPSGDFQLVTINRSAWGQLEIPKDVLRAICFQLVTETESLAATLLA